MEDESKSSIETAEGLKVPDALLQKLHAATERFHRAKEAMEASVISTGQLTHQQTVDQATDLMRAAEREVEEITMQIHTSLVRPVLPKTH